MPAGLAVDDDARLHEERPDPAHEALREEDGEEREHPEDRAAIDDDEEHEHEQRRHEQERRVDSLERGARVGGVAGGPGDLRLEAVGALGERLADGVDGVDENRLVAVSDDLRHDERCLAVFGELRRADRDHAFGS